MNDMTTPTAKQDATANFPAMLKAYGAEIARALPKHMNGDRMARIALTAFRSTPQLAKCEPRSVFAAVIQSSQLGLEVGLMGESHLVPFNSKDGMKCQLIPGYQGLMKLARNSGLVEDIYAHEVRENDRFEMTLGLKRELIHEPLMDNGFPASDEKRGEITGFYAVAVFKDGSRTFQAMSRAQTEQIRDNSKGYQAAKRYKKESLWDTDFLSMGLKTVIRRLCKYLPKSPELVAALTLDAQNERGKDQNLDVTTAIEGTWTPAPDEEDGNGLPPMPDAQFAKELADWAPLLSKGKKTPEQIIATVATKFALTEEQRKAIYDAAKPAEVAQ